MKTKRTLEQKTTESVVVRGIAASIQAMAFPDFDSLNKIMQQHGYKLVPINNQ